MPSAEAPQVSRTGPSNPHKQLWRGVRYHAAGHRATVNQRMSIGTHIYHLAQPEDIRHLDDSEAYQAPSLATEGFIHCASAAQLPGVIQRYYANAHRLVLLTIDTAQLGNTLVMENTVGGEELFPHVYEAIATAAIVDRRKLEITALQSIAQSQEYLPT